MLTVPVAQEGAEAVTGEGAGEVACPRCGVHFTPARRNQRYCNPACQKAASRNTSRGSQKIADSHTARQRADRERGRAFLLNDDLHRKPPADRPAFMDAILQAARESDRHLHRTLSDRSAFYDFGHDYAGRPNLVRTLDDYCKRSRNGARVWQIIAAKWKSRDVEIRPLALYRDIWTGPDAGPESSLPTYVKQDPADFLARIGKLRRVAALMDQPDTDDRETEHNPPSCPI